MKTIFTTGQVAKICKVAPRQVSKWFDSGRLRGYRIPGSQDRRIPREHLIRFLKEHGMPLGELEEEAMGHVILVGVDLPTGERITELLSEGFRVRQCGSAFEAGIEAESRRPDCIVVDFGMGSGSAAELCRQMSEHPKFKGVAVIALHDTETIPDRTQKEVFQKPFCVEVLAAHIRTLVNRSKQLA